MSTTWRRTNSTIWVYRLGERKWEREWERDKEKINYFGSRWENAYSCGDLRLNLLYIYNLLGLGLSFVKFLAERISEQTHLLLYISLLVQAHFCVDVN